jgi:hypothetical protein
MLQSSTRNAFVVSADEIMFLQFELIEKVEYCTHDRRDPVNLFVEPWLSYSEPIKFSEILDEKEAKVPVKLALMYLLHCGMQKDWEMQAEIGNSMKYAAKTKAGERYVPKLDWLKIRGERDGKQCVRSLDWADKRSRERHRAIFLNKPLPKTLGKGLMRLCL